MTTPNKNTLMVVSLACFVAGWILVFGSRSFVEKFLTRKGARIMLAVKAENYGLMSELVEELAKTRPHRTVLRPIDNPRDSVWCSLFVDDTTASVSIDAANRFADDLCSEFTRRSVEAPSIFEPAVPVSIVTSFHRALCFLAGMAGALLLCSSVITGIVHFVRVRKGTPPPLPGQEAARDTVTYDY